MSTPKDVAKAIRARANNLPRELRSAEFEVLRIAADRAWKLSSGPYSQELLTLMGHPYSKKHPHPPMHPGVINVQRGVFRASWRRKIGGWKGGTLKSTLSNASEFAHRMRGTKLMIERPIWKLIADAVRPVRNKKMRAALRRAIHP